MTFYAACGFTHLARAGSYEGREPPLKAREVMDADAAAAAVRRATGGRVLGIEPSANGASPGYHVKVLLEDGRVRILSVDAHSGTLSE
jgi:uncharacterized membrane protein YkoI